MLRKMLLATTLASFALSLPAFGATITGTFSFSGTDTGTINFSAVTPAPGPGVTASTYVITSVNGSTDGTAIGGILPPDFYPADPLDFNDNFVLSPAVNGGALDFNGLSYYLANGTVPTSGSQCGETGIATCVNLFYVPSGDFNPGYFTDINNNPGDTALDLTVTFGTGGTVTPEPESLALAGTGILALAGVLRSRFKRA